MILVGTSGFQHRDWVRVFYPAGLDPSLWFRYYCRHFGCCELTFTYYRIPEVNLIKQLIEESGGGMQFVFRVPFRLLEAGREAGDLAQRFVSALWPLKESAQLAGVVAQFGPSFGFHREEFECLCRLRDILGGLSLIADFGCPEWLTPRAAHHLATARIALACVDGGTRLADKTWYCATTGLAYVRFQGRNQSRWVPGDGSARHDYLYSRAELAAAVPEIRRLEQESERVLVLMNNPWRGQAPINARMLVELLGPQTSDFRPQTKACGSEV
ncbi:MAG: hypothetical protein H6Q05_3585 [Acidobacteria bacterium]|nr:hypothetical protein [Acidobacteriota bacterium]